MENDIKESTNSEFDWDNIPVALTSEEIAEVTAEIRFWQPVLPVFLFLMKKLKTRCMDCISL